MWIKLLILVLKRGMTRRQNGEQFASYFNISFLLPYGVGEVVCCEMLWGAEQEAMLADQGCHVTFAPLLQPL